MGKSFPHQISQMIIFNFYLEFVLTKILLNLCFPFVFSHWLILVSRMMIFADPTNVRFGREGKMNDLENHLFDVSVLCKPRSLVIFQFYHVYSIFQQFYLIGSFFFTWFAVDLLYVFIRFSRKNLLSSPLSILVYIFRFITRNKNFIGAINPFDIFI